MVQAAIRDLDFGMPGPQWGRTVPEDPEVAETLEVPPSLYCAVMCVEPEPIDPAHEPVRVPHRHAAGDLRMARAVLLGRGRAAERLYLQSRATVLEAVLKRAVEGSSTPVDREPAATIALDYPVRPGRDTAGARPRIPSSRP